MNEEEMVHIEIFKKSNVWRFEIKFGNYMLAGLGKDFEDVEIMAYKALTGLPKHGTIHIHYLDGKSVLPRKED